MKRIFYIFTFIFAIVFAFDANAKIYYTCDKQGGKFVFNWFHSYIGYDKVMPSITVDPITGNQVRHIDCFDPGPERCKFIISSGQTRVSPNCTITTELIENTVNEILTSIEDNIIEGKYSGSVTKKVQTTSIEGNSSIISFDANWSNGDSEGDSKIIISIDEVKL